MWGRLRVSFGLIVRDGARSLRACLESVAPLVDEMIVVDTGSTDGSAGIAKSLGARVLHTPWEADFASARNAYVQAAKGDWLLSLDADEILEPVSRASLEEMLRRHSNVAFLFNVRNYFWWKDFTDQSLLGRVVNGGLPPGMGCSISHSVRLFPRRPNIRYCYPVHESLLPALGQYHIRLQTFPAVIHHTGFLLAAENLAKKIALYESLGRKKIRQYPRCFPGYLELAKVLLFSNRASEAEQVLRHRLRFGPGNGVTHYWIAQCLLRQGRIEASWQHVIRSLRQYPGCAKLLDLRAQLMEFNKSCIPSAHSNKTGGTTGGVCGETLQDLECGPHFNTYF